MSEPRRLIAGRYRLDEALASGGMGVVWRGWDERLERVVAIKQIRLQPGLSASEADAARERAMREARITARLHHPGAVPIYDVVEHDGQPCLIMQFLPSVSLQERLHDRQTLPPVEVARIGSELAAALTAAHQVGIVHRDVKPGNVLLTEDGSAKLTDFGISHALGDVSLTSTGMVTGTPAFLAPEVARGESATYASDVFALGSTLYTATEGHPPVAHDDNAMAVLHRVASGNLIPPRRSGPLTPLLLRMLDPDPALRPGMQDAWFALAALQENQAAPATPVGRPEPTTAVLAPPRNVPADDAALSRTTLTTRAVRQKRSGSRLGRAMLVAAALLAGLSLAVGLVYLVTGNKKGGGAVTASTRSSTTRAKATATSTAARATTTVSTPGSSSTSRPVSSSSRSPSSSSTTSRTSTTTTSSAPSSSTSASGSTEARLAGAVTDYYSLMPSNINAGWARLTPGYQSGHAGGFTGYQRFWAAIESVSTSNVVGQPPGSALATITYHYKDGRTVVERTRFGFVTRDGQLLISTSSTVTSRTI